MPGVQPIVPTPQGVFALNALPAEVTEQKPEISAPALGHVKAEIADEVKTEEKEEVKQPVEGPVSKWTMVDYDSEAAAFPGVE